MNPGLDLEKVKLGKLYHGETLGDVDLSTFQAFFPSSHRLSSMATAVIGGFRIDDNTPVGG